MRRKTTRKQADVELENPIIGTSPEAKRLRRAAKRLAKIDSNILIIGETGTGKEFIARQIYSLSTRRNYPFVEVNCAALGKTIDTKDLYGEEKAGESVTTGLFEKVNKGVLFLDNVGDMSPEYQEELFRVIRDRKFRKVGGRENIEVDMRIFSTSNRSLSPDVEEGKFIKELYYLLNTLTLLIPPLRERKQDIPELFSFFLKKHYEQEGQEEPAVPSEIFESILEYDWKGNVRELENTVQNLVTMSPEGELSADFLPFRAKKHPLDFLEPRNLKAVISEIEIYLIKKALSKYGGNQVKAARLLGVPEATLRFKMKKYAIPKE